MFLWGRIWRWTLTLVVVIGGHLFLSIPALRGAYGPVYESNAGFWISAAFVLTGPLAVGFTVYTLVDDHKKRQRKESARLFRDYVRHTCPNGRQRWYEVDPLTRIMGLTMGWKEPAHLLKSEIFASSSISSVRRTRAVNLATCSCTSETGATLRSMCRAASRQP